MNTEPAAARLADAVAGHWHAASFVAVSRSPLIAYPIDGTPDVHHEVIRPRMPRGCVRRMAAAMGDAAAGLPHATDHARQAQARPQECRYKKQVAQAGYADAALQEEHLASLGIRALSEAPLLAELNSGG